MIGKHNRDPHIFDIKNPAFRSVRLRFPLNESSPSLRPGPILPKGVGVRPRARSAPHLRLMQQRSTRGSGGRVEAALQGAQGGRTMPWHGWVWRTIWVKKTSPIDSEHFPHLKSLKVVSLDSVHLIFRHTQEFVLIFEGRVGPHQKW